MSNPGTLLGFIRSLFLPRPSEIPTLRVPDSKALEHSYEDRLRTAKQFLRTARPEAYRNLYGNREP